MKNIELEKNIKNLIKQLAEGTSVINQYITEEIEQLDNKVKAVSAKILELQIIERKNLIILLKPTIFYKAGVATICSKKRLLQKA